MTQKELNELYLYYDSEKDMPYDQGMKCYQNEISEFEYAGGDWKENGHEEFISVLRKYGFKVFNDPSTDGTDSWGYVIIPPKQR